MRAILVTAALVSAPITAAAAQDDVAFDALAKARYVVAERQLAPQVALGEREPGVLLNLAAAYVATGRKVEAARLYGMVQGEENALMSPASGGAVWSHDIAARGLVLAQR